MVSEENVPQKQGAECLMADIERALAMLCNSFYTVFVDCKTALDSALRRGLRDKVRLTLV